MRKLICIILLCLSSTTSANSIGKIKTSPLVIGESIEFYSKILNEKRRLNVYLPAIYNENNTQDYPVIYLLDGAKSEDFIHIAGLVQFGSFSWINLIPESIVVGIANVDRKRDFTAKSENPLDIKEFPSHGGAKPFIEAIASEIQPLIESQYRTNNIKTLIGQSLGGLLATDILINQPTLFNHYLIVSPSLWWNDGALLNSIDKPTIEGKVFIAVGKEGEIMERDAYALFKKLSAKKANNVHYQFFENQNHGDTLHLAVYQGFEALFKSKVALHKN
ncbi:alpha/beta hydrolase [Thalassotalea sediminis]|uniref:alpha/beta hydrolase n=1 Tax=Thalassotalea sediminis TaxID=1759089 RepID=UPI0025735226|nr:alpha/beta hydrolase-fold protein [Thalassotalea sediminis]